MSCDCGKNKPSDKYDDWCSQYFTRVPLKGQYFFIFFFYQNLLISDASLIICITVR